MSHILIIDDDRSLLRSMELQLTRKRHRVTVAATGADGMTKAESGQYQMILLDVTLPDADGISLLKKFHAMVPERPVVMITGRQDMSLIIEAMKAGAFDYVRKPFELDDILILLEKSRLQKSVKAIPAAGTPANTPDRLILGTSRPITEVLKQIGLLAKTSFPVLIQGESGTGKELVARMLHQASTPDRPFVAVNCAAMVSGLLASELFGHERGSFTGASTRHLGKLEHAGQGTFFLDEIGEIPLDFQSKLLRVLQEREFERVGSNQRIPFRARVIAATHQSLSDMVSEGTFREDLFYRISVGEIHLPPLRKRTDDIPVLVSFFIQRHKQTTGSPVNGIDQEGLQVLMKHGYPGNVRELENILARAMVSAQGTVLSALDIDSAIRNMATKPAAVQPLWQSEREAIILALEHFSWNISRTADKFEISPTTLRKKIKDYGLKRPGI